MRELLTELFAALDSGRRVAVCRLVETRGSTPQKAGAAMLVFADGSQRGTLGGGCVEAEVKRQALQIIDAGAARIARFQLDDDYGWDDGLICGGRMQVLIDPIESAAEHAYWRELARLDALGSGGTEAIVFDSQSSGLHASSCYLFDPQGQAVAQLRPPKFNDPSPDHPSRDHSSLDHPLPDGDPPDAVRLGVRPLDERPTASVRQGVAFLPFLPRCRLIIVGGGHVGRAVGDLAAGLDFDVWVVDDREEYVAQERFPRAERRIAGPMAEVLPSLDITPHTYCLIVTRGHNHDEEALYHLIDRGASYVGMIGSRRKIKLIFDDLMAEGVARESLARVHAPVGLDIGSQTVAEIAISIAAELIAHRNLGASPCTPSDDEDAAAPRRGESLASLDD